MRSRASYFPRTVAEEFVRYYADMERALGELPIRHPLLELSLDATRRRLRYWRQRRDEESRRSRSLSRPPRGRPARA